MKGMRKTGAGRRALLEETPRKWEPLSRSGFAQGFESGAFHFGETISSRREMLKVVRAKSRTGEGT
jgi:hypothetical protein